LKDPFLEKLNYLVVGYFVEKLNYLVAGYFVEKLNYLLYDNLWRS